MNRSIRRVLTTAVFAPATVAFVMVSKPAQACTHDGPAVDVVKEPLPARGPLGGSEPFGIGGPLGSSEPLGIKGSLGRPAPAQLGGLRGAANVRHRATDGVGCRLPIGPGALPGQPLMMAGTMKDALPAGLGDTELPVPIANGSPGGSVAPDGSSGMFGGLPGLGVGMPTHTFGRLPVTPALC